MAKISNLFIDLEDAIEAGNMSFAEIAAFYEVPRSWVDEVAKQLAERYAEVDDVSETQEWHDFDPDC